MQIVNIPFIILVTTGAGITLGFRYDTCALSVLVILVTHAVSGSVADAALVLVENSASDCIVKVKDF